MDPAILNIAEPVGADYCPGMGPHAIADLGSGIQDHVGEKVHIFAQHAVGSDEVASLKDRTRANAHLFGKDTIGANMGAGIYLSRGWHDCSLMDARSEGHLRKEQRQHL